MFAFEVDAIIRFVVWSLYDFSSVAMDRFTYVTLGIGILICCISFIGFIGAEAISGCFLCFVSFCSF